MYYKMFDCKMRGADNDNVYAEGFKYKVGQMYYIPPEELKLNEYGFHCWREARECLKNHSRNDRLFEIKVMGNSIQEDHLVVTNHMSIQKEITGYEKNKLLLGRLAAKIISSKQKKSFCQIM